jgi:His/Glu/Gln/Arg/opine family amino acid ABC transporter permease subunit
VQTFYNPLLFLQNARAVISGAETTLLLGASAVALSLAFGLIGWVFKTSDRRLMSWLGNAYVESLRNTPTLLYIYLIYFGLAGLKIRFSPFTSAMLALGVQGGAYMTEIIRGAFSAMSEEQRQAARALGFRPLKSLLYIELPQMLRVAFPALGNQIVSIVLGTSLASVIAVPELTYQSQIMSESTYQYFGVFSIDAILYIILVQVINGLWHFVERIWFGKWATTV